MKVQKPNFWKLEGTTIKPLDSTWDLEVDNVVVSGVVDGDLNMDSNKITNLADPTANQDAATKAYADSLGGGDFSGPASSTDNAIVRFDGTGGKTGQNSGVTIDDSDNVSGLGTLSSASGTLTIDETASLSNYLQNVVDDTTPQLGGDLDANSNNLTNLADPTANQEAATKKYVDDNAGGGGVVSTEKIAVSYPLFGAMPSTQDTAGSGAITDSDNESGIRIDSGATGSSHARIVIGRFPKGYSKSMRAQLYSQFIAISDNGTLYIYFFGNSTDPAFNTKYAGFRISASGGTDTVLAVSKDGTTEETTDITGSFGSTSAGNQNRALMVDYTAGVDVKFYVNGTLVATHSTNIPPDSDTSTNVEAFVCEADNASDSAATTFIVSALNAEKDF